MAMAMAMLLSTTIMWLPIRDARLSLLILLLLIINIEPCVVAYQHPFVVKSTILGVTASSLRAKNEASSPEGREQIKNDVQNPSFSSPRPFQEEEDELCYLEDIPGTIAGETCFVSNPSSVTPEPDSSQLFSSLPFNTRDPTMTTEQVLRYLPFIMPLFAYTTYELTASIFDHVVEMISNNNWVAVDGGEYQGKIITPAINGLIVPSIALLFATMNTNTINTLRQRQFQIRTSLNTEANDLRMLSTMVDSFPAELMGVRNHLREYLIQYSSRVIAESRPGLTNDAQMLIGSMDTELNGFLGVLNKLSMSSYATMYADTMLPASNYTLDESYFEPYEKNLGLAPNDRKIGAPFLSPNMFSEMYDALTRLRHERSIRLAALQATYPVLHYVILALLAASICIAFLMETNQELLIFLSAIQLRIMWSMLIGTFSGEFALHLNVNWYYTKKLCSCIANGCHSVSSCKLRYEGSVSRKL